MNCEQCSRAINPTTDAHYVHVSGWAKARSQGGTNAITQPVRDGRVRCSTCMDPRKEIEGQTSIYDL